MNSRSQTKIRRIQQTNLLAEERYLKSKGLLYEGPQEDILKCFTDNQVDLSMIPSTCTGGTPNITPCVTALQTVIKNMPEDKKIKMTTCLKDLLTNNVGKTIQKGVEVGTDILKKGSDILGGGIKF